MLAKTLRSLTARSLTRTLATATGAAPPTSTEPGTTKSINEKGGSTDGKKPDGNRGWTEGEFHSVEDILEKHIPAKELAQVKRVLYGLNQGTSVDEITIPSAAQKIANDHNFDLTISKFKAGKEDTREPRIVRFGVTQNSIHLPTDAPVQESIQSMWDIHENFVEAAAAAGTNVLCFQEAWTMPFAFCTREKLPWTNFAESAEDGPTTKFLQKLARKHNMVIVSPILERDEKHGGTIWNTAVVIGNNGNVIGKHRKNHIPRVGDFNESRCLDLSIFIYLLIIFFIKNSQ